MDRYKPGYLGKVIPADDQNKLTDFVQNKYDSFSKIYDSCKEDSKKISDINVVESTDTDASELSVKISTDEETIQSISERVKDDDTVKMNGNLITARVKN